MELHINKNTRQAGRGRNATDFLGVSPKTNDDFQFIATVIAIIFEMRRRRRRQLR